MSRDEWRKGLIAEATTRSGQPLVAQAVLESEHSHEPGICRGQETKDCNTCPLWKSLGNRKYKGTRIPGGYGKCIRPGHHCSPFLVREGIGATKKEER